METKNSLRIRMKEKRRQYSAKSQWMDSRKLVNQLVLIPEIQKESTFLLYSAKKPELSLEILRDWCMKNGKEIYFPRVKGDRMDFFRVKSVDDLVPGFFGILEPGEQCKALSKKEAICFVPGVAFDKKGNRIGYGKGYYDRYFRENAGLGVKKIGVAYDFQVVDEIEADDFDEKMDWVITPSEIMKFDKCHQKG